MTKRKVKLMKPKEELYNHITSINAFKVLVNESKPPWMIKIENKKCGCKFELWYKNLDDGSIKGDNVLATDLINRRTKSLEVPDTWPHSKDYKH